MITTLTETPVVISTRKPNDLTERAMASLKSQFAEHNHNPSPKQMDGLKEIATVIQGQADRSLPSNNLFCSFMPPGLGKTSTVISTISHLVAMPEYDHVGVLIFVNRLEEITTYTEAMGLHAEDFSVLCSKTSPEYGWGNQDKQAARVMFSTQAQLELRTKNAESFSTTEAFHYKGKPREVRIWDEAILPARTFALADCDIFEMVKPLQKGKLFEAAKMARTFGMDLSDKKNDEQITVPDVKAHYPHEQPLIDCFDDGSDAAANCLAWWNLSGLTVRVRKTLDATVLHYEDILPTDLGPLLVLDASGLTRQTYVQWAKERHGLHFLPSPQKHYRGLTINICDHASGRNARRDNPEFFINAYSEAAKSLPPNDLILAIVHKPKHHKDPDFEKAMTGRVNSKNLAFLTFGRHTATNKYKDFKHVMLIGLRHYSDAQNEIVLRAAAGMGMTKQVSKDEIEDIRLGEVSHHLYQAACRGMVRKSEGDGCPNGTTLWVTCRTSGAQSVPISLFERLFPEATIIDWNRTIKLSKSEQKYLEAIQQNPGLKDKSYTEQAMTLRVSRKTLFNIRASLEEKGQMGKSSIIMQ